MKDQQFWEAAEYLKGMFDYTFEMMPLLFALSKSTKCNTSEAAKLIQEGKDIIKEMPKESNESWKKSPERSRSKSPESPTSCKSKNGNFPLDLTVKTPYLSERKYIENLVESDKRKSSTGNIFRPYQLNSNSSEHKTHGAKDQNVICKTYNAVFENLYQVEKTFSQPFKKEIFQEIPYKFIQKSSTHISSDYLNSQIL